MCILLLVSMNLLYVELFEVLMYNHLYIIITHRFRVHRKHQESDNMYVCKLIKIRLLYYISQYNANRLVADINVQSRNSSTNTASSNKLYGKQKQK